MDRFSVSWRSRWFQAGCRVRIEQGLVKRLGSLQCNLHRKPLVGRHDGLLPQPLTQLRLAGGPANRGRKVGQARRFKYESVPIMRD
jgi:hypothetical protein